MQALRTHGTQLTAAILALIMLAVLAAACGGGDADATGTRDGVTAADVEAEIELEEAAVAHEEEEEGTAISLPAADASAADASTAIQHHWQALTAIKAGTVDDAVHHVEHLIGLVEGEHRAVMEDVLANLQAGKLHDAEHDIELMLAGTAEPNLSNHSLHLQMALSTMDLGNIEDALHHMEHFVLTAPSELGHDAEAIVAALQAGGTDDAKEQITVMIQSLLGEAETSVAVDGHDDGEAAHDGDAHADEAGDDHEATVDEHDDADAHEEGADDHAGLDEHEARTITVIATDFAYGTAEVHVTVGETIRLVLVNQGTVLHDITAAGFIGDANAVNTAEHAHMEGLAGMDFHTAAETGETTELLFVAEEAGRYKLFCTVPGHEQLGMTAVLVVEEA